MRTSNPVFTRQDSFAPREWGGIMADLQRTEAQARRAATSMTVRGTATKTGILLAIVAGVGAAAWSWASKDLSVALPTAIFGLLGSLILGLVISFKPTSAPFLAPVYAALEGTVLGVLSLVVTQRVGVQGGWMVGQAVLITLAILAALLIAFSAGLIRIGSTGAKVITVALMGVALTYLASFVMRMLGFGSIGFIHEGGPIGIGFSLVVIILASLTLVLDFQFVEQGVENEAPKHMEWYAAYGLLVTLVWLYFEILRLLAKLRDD